MLVTVTGNKWRDDRGTHDIDSEMVMRLQRRLRQREGDFDGVTEAPVTETGRLGDWETVTGLQKCLRQRQGGVDKVTEASCGREEETETTSTMTRGR